MTNVRLSLVAGYPVEAPAPAEHVALPTLSLSQFWKRISNSIYHAERRRTEAEIGGFIERNGGTLTDDLERQIGQRYGT